MRSRGGALALLFPVAMLAAGAGAQDGPGLGIPADPARVEARNLTILPDGSGLPPGSGTAVAGAAVYAEQCRACHGAGGRGGPNDMLVGGAGTLAADRSRKTIGSYWPCATTVFDYIRRAMPYQAPGSLSADEVYAVTAWLLHENGIIEAGQVIDAESLPAVLMPNHDGFDDPYAAAPRCPPQ